MTEVGAGAPGRIGDEPGREGDGSTDQLRRVLLVARALSRTGDLRPLLELAASSACEVVGYRRCWAAVRAADGSYRYEVAAGLPEDPARRLVGHTLSQSAFDALMDVALSIGGVYCVEPDDEVRDRPDVWDSIPVPPEVPFPTRGSGLAEIEPVDGTLSGWQPGSLLIVPFPGLEGENVGFFCLDDPVGQARVSSVEALVLETIAELVVVGLEAVGVRALGRTSAAVAEAQRRQLEELFGASLRVRGSLALDDVLTEIAVAMTTAGGFERAAVYLRDHAGLLTVRATVGLTDDDDTKLRGEPIGLDEFGPLMRPEMLISRSFLFDHRRFDLPPELDAKLVTPEARPDYVEGRWHSEDTLTVPLTDQDGELLGLITVDEPSDGLMPDRAHIQALEYFADQCAVAVSQARQYEAVQAEAATDPLTGLANRRALADAVHAAVEGAVREGTPCSLLFMDIDQFKRINDTLGHAAGDDVLVLVSRVLSERLRRGDLLGRYGGEEFVALLPGTPVGDGLALAEDLRGRVAALEADPICRGMTVTVSIGVAAVSATVTTADQLLTVADGALYDAKRAGRDCVRLAAP